MILRTVRDVSMLIKMVLYILAIDHARKLKLGSYVHLPSIIKMFPYCYVRVIMCSVGEVIIFDHGFYISVLKHIRMLIKQLCSSSMDKFIPFILVNLHIL